MLPVEREQYIIEKLDELGTVKVEDIANELDVSLMTIRRDLIDYRIRVFYIEVMEEL